MEDGPSGWVPVILLGDWDGILGSWHWLGSISALQSLGSELQIEDSLILSLIEISKSLTNKKNFSAVLVLSNRNGLTHSRNRKFTEGI